MKRKYRVPDMYCVNCPMHLEGLEDELQGVRYIKASFQKLTMEVDFDESRLSEQQIIAAAEQIGYHLVLIPA